MEKSGAERQSGQGRGDLPVAGTSQEPRLIGSSPVMRHLGDLVRAVAPRHSTVLIQGESGTGKELVARDIHAGSARAAGPFVPVDCSTLRDTLFESQLFGHARGAFTGAEQATLGFFRAADGGTLFLDEIGELELQVQAKLLRAMQERAIVPLGSIKPVAVNVRVLAATHRDLKAMVERGAFRADLYYRLNVVCLCVPPLRERRADIPELARHFLDHLADLYEEPAKQLAPETLDILQAYDWPGNVRELANAVEHAYVLSPGAVLTPEDFPMGIQTVAYEGPVLEGPMPSLEHAEEYLITRALREAHGNQRLAAQLLKIDRRRLHRKLERYGLDPWQFRK